jgi:hypothetical protein
MVVFKSQPSAPMPEMAHPPAASGGAAAPAATPARVIPAAVIAKPSPTPAEREAAIQAEEDKLYAWSMNDDAASLSNILNDLASPEREIRLAAIKAAVQFNDTNAVPVLRQLAASAEDNEEANAMLKAAAFLDLPDADFNSPGDNSRLTPEQTQAIAQNGAAAAARLEASQQRHNHNIHNPAPQPAPQPDNGQ